MRLIYWYSPCIDDSTVFSIRCRTKKEVVQRLQNEHGLTEGELPTESYGRVRKMVVEYRNGFDLLDRCLGDSVYEEYN